MNSYEVAFDGYVITTDRSKISAASVYALLATTYWAKSRTADVVRRSMENSLCFGLYKGEVLAGFARVITDYTTLGYLCDVVIDEEFRGRGLGKRLVAAVHAHPDLQSLSRWYLITKDAHGLYKKFGWTEVPAPEMIMVKTPSGVTGGPQAGRSS